MAAPDDPASPVGTPPAVRISRAAIIHFPEEEVADAASFAAKLDRIRIRHPQWRVEGAVGARGYHVDPTSPTQTQTQTSGTPPAPVVPHRPYLRRRQLEVRNRTDKSDRHRKAREYVLETELHVLARTALAARDEGSDAEISSSDGEVHPREVPTALKRGQHVLIEVPPHQNQRGTITEMTNPDCFKVTFADGASWWCSQDEVTVLPAAATASSRSVSLSTFEELARLRDEKDLLLAALRACPPEAYSSHLPPADAARVNALLGRR